MNDLVMLVTVTKEDGTEPVAHGIYHNSVQLLHGLNNVGIHPGFDCVATPLFNSDGTRGGLFFAHGQYIATVSSLPIKEAAALARGESVWDVPDTLEGIE